MDEIQKAKRGVVLNSIGFCVGLATLLIDVIPVIAVGAIIFCPYFAIKDLRKYRMLTKLHLEKPGPFDPTSVPESYHM